MLVLLPVVRFQEFPAWVAGTALATLVLVTVTPTLTGASAWLGARLDRLSDQLRDLHDGV
jgi:hypothetical protein